MGACKYIILKKIEMGYSLGASNHYILYPFTSILIESWIDKDGLHCIGQGTPPSDENYEQMTQDYQKSIRNSPMWDEWIKQFGKKKAEEMLEECVAKLG